jgi:hypothetical protein
MSSHFLYFKPDAEIQIVAEADPNPAVARVAHVSVEILEVVLR